MINRIALATATSFAVFAAPLTLLAETPPIEKIAPENTLLILGTRNGAQAFENLKKTPLWTLWQSDKMKIMRADAMKQMDEGLAEMFKELGVEQDTLQPPTGTVGVAVFTVPDPDLGVPELSLMAVGNWGENAEKMDALVKAALEKGVTDEKISFEEKDIVGRNVHIIDLSKLQPEEPEEADENAMGMGMPLPAPADLIGGMTKMHYLRDGNTLMLCSDLTALTDALDTIDGKGDEAGTFAQRKDFQETLALVGSESDGYGVLLTRNIMDVVAAGNPMMAMAKPITRLVVGEVAGYSVALRLDADGAIAKQTLGVFMPEGKAGLTELLDQPSPRSTVPGFAAAGAMSYSSFNFDFSGVMDVIETTLTAMPIPQAAEAIPEMEKTMGPILAALGSKIHSASMSAGGKQQSIFAIECKDPQGFENAFGVAAGQGGLEARDFLGQRIYTIEADMMPMMPMGGGMGGESMSIGIGGGHVYIGGTPGVEQALRATGQADAGGAGLGKDETFQRATNFLGNEPVVAWGYIDIIAMNEVLMKQQEEMTRQAIEQMKEFDPETAAEMEKDLAAQKGAAEDFDPAFFKQYIGPSTWKMTSNDKGFVLNFYTLPAAN